MRSAASRAEIDGSGEDVGPGVPVEPETADDDAPDIDGWVPEVDGLVDGREAVVAGELVTEPVVPGGELPGRGFTVELTITVEGVAGAGPDPERLAPDPDIGPVPDARVGVDPVGVDPVGVDPVVGGSSVPTVLMVASSSVVGGALSWPLHPESANTATSSAAHLPRAVNVVIVPPAVEAPVSPDSVPDSGRAMPQVVHNAPA